MKKTVVFIVLVGILIISACSTGGATPAAGGGETPKLSLTQVKFATMANDAQDLMLVYVPDELFWPKLGFTEPAKILSTDDILPALVSGEAWIAQGGTNVFMTANEKSQGSVEFVIVGIDKDNEVRLFATRPGLTTVADLKPGSKISGGDMGDWDELVLRTIMDELKINPKEMDIISMGGGADARMESLIAGQLDAAIIQPRNVNPLTRAGGVILYDKLVSAPQESWAVTRDTLNKNKDAVCAFVLGRIQGKRWAYEGDDHTKNRPQAVELAKKHQIEPSEDELADWVSELEKNQSMDGGTTYPAMDLVVSGIKSMGLITEAYDWRAHADFTCVHEAQQKLGLPQRP